MVFSYLEPVLHKAQLVLGGGHCFEFFSYSFPRAVAMSGTQRNPLECPSPTGCARQPFRGGGIQTQKGAALEGFYVLTRRLPDCSRAFPRMAA